MFTGLVEELGTVEARIQTDNADALAPTSLSINAPLVAKDAKIGDSIAVNGCCLTVVKKSKNVLTFEAGSETLSRTNLGRLQVGSRVNLERSLQLGDRLGGHLVTGHVDAVATVIKRRDEADWAHLVFRVPLRLTSQIAGKGSITVDGVSLTVVQVERDRFNVALIPHTLANTTIGTMQVGDVANIETDLLAKYVEQQLESKKITEEPVRRAYGESRLIK
jgi:riboflavin synthase